MNQPVPVCGIDHVRGDCNFLARTSGVRFRDGIRKESPQYRLRARKPRHRKLRVTSGSRTIARRKSTCAGRSSALNRRSRSHISGENLEQATIQESAQKFHQIGPKQFGFDIEFREKLLVGRVNIRRTRHNLPHSRAGLVQSEVLLRLEVQQDGFSIQEADQNVGRRGGSVRK